MIKGILSISGVTTSPLSESTQSSLNSLNTPYISQNDYHVDVYSNQEDMSNSPPSSPFVANIPERNEDRENSSPNKARTSTKSPIDREHTSPLKILKSRTSPTSMSQSPQKDADITRSPERASPLKVLKSRTSPLSQSPQKDQDTLRSPRKLSSPEKRFPVKVSSPEKRPAPIEMSIEDALRDNEGLTKAIQILEDDNDSNADSMDDTLTSMRAGPEVDEGQNMDDTMVSTFSTFSAVPDMTTFAKLGHSPSKYAGTMGPALRRNMNTPATARKLMNRSPSPTPRGHRYNTSRDEGNTTNLLDFTAQMNGFSGYQSISQTPARQARHSPLKSMPDMSWAATPSASRNNMSNLLDFDIPPAPTPRSLPSITPRELESLKSNFLSEISSLKASLSGKEAEVQSLKTAVGDAEKRVGESMEQIREERNHKEQLAAEKEEWEKRGREMEAVLRNVKEEIVHGERERDELEGRLDESERRREAAEMMAQEAESKMAAMRAGKPFSPSEVSESKSEECHCGGKAVEIAVEKVSRELHTLYKDKHETKVAALKKSYEKRWDKKIRELEDQVEDLSKENEDLRRDTTMTKVEPKDPLEATIDLQKQAAGEAKTKELEAELEGLVQEVKSVKHDNAELRKMLEEERIEKGKLVTAVDEMLPLCAAFDDMLATMNAAPSNNASPQKVSQPATVENLRGSISRASGLRAPTSSKIGSESRIGRGGFGVPSGHERTRSGSSQGRPGSGLGHRSGIMSSIEKMGSYKGRGE